MIINPKIHINISDIRYDILGSADWHLSNDSSVGTVDKFGVCSMLRLIEQFFYKMVDRAVRESTILVICGDTINVPTPDPIVVKIFHKILKYIVINKVKTIFISGNHEFDGLRSVIDSYEELKDIGLDYIYFIFKSKIIKINDIVFYCVPYTGRSVEEQYEIVATFIKRAVEEQASKKILLLHYPIVGCKFDSSSAILVSGFNLRSLLNKYGNPFNYIIAGDFHDRQRLVGIPNFLYLGQPYQGDFSAAGKKRGYTLFSLEYRKTLFIPNKNIEFIVINNLKSIVDVPKKLDNKIVRIFIEAGVNRNAVIDAAYHAGAHKVQVRMIRDKLKNKIDDPVKFKFEVDHKSAITSYASTICDDKKKLQAIIDSGLALYLEVTGG